MDSTWRRDLQFELHWLRSTIPKLDAAPLPHQVEDWIEYAGQHHCAWHNHMQLLLQTAQAPPTYKTDDYYTDFASFGAAAHDVRAARDEVC
eukprot:10258775-Alexandrium_andersonii.AAC.1